MNRIVLYDRTCWTGRRGLSPIWAAGSRMYRMLRRVERIEGVDSWAAALAYLGAQPELIDEIQFWGHGKWGCAMVGDDRFDVDALARHATALDAIRVRLAPNALLWFRTCETLGARPGQAFARRLADRMGARVAGHTYIIGYQQSGLHGLAPGMRPDWSEAEGLVEGTPDEPRKAAWSRRGLPNTITALVGEVPAAWFSAIR
jgi:hypothetical protein